MKKGHVHTQIMEFDNDDETEDEYGYVYHQSLPGLNWSTCLLIDSKSIVDIFNNAGLLAFIRQKTLKFHCNTEYICMTKKDGLGILKYGIIQKELQTSYHLRP